MLVNISNAELYKMFKKNYLYPQLLKESTIALMKKFICDFEYIETGKNLDQKM